MKPNPDEDGDDQKRARSQPPSLTPEARETREVQQDGHGKDDDANHYTRPLAQQPDRWRLAWRWCRAKWWESWHFDNNPSFFDALTSIVSLVGVGFLIGQMWQTQDALHKTNESNIRTERALEFAKEAQRRADADSVDESRRAERIAKSAENSAQSALDAVAAAKVANRSAETLANAAKQQAEASKRYAELTATQLHKGQRAYIVLKKTTLRELPTAGKEPFIYSQFQNYGLTPALSARISIDWQIAPNEGGLKFREPDEKDVVFTLPAGANTDGESGFGDPPRPLRAQDLERVQKRSDALYFYGVVDYEDIFGARNRTEFCRYYVPENLELYVCTTRNVVK